MPSPASNEGVALVAPFSVVPRYRGLSISNPISLARAMREASSVGRVFGDTLSSAARKNRSKPFGKSNSCKTFAGSPPTSASISPTWAVIWFTWSEWMGPTALIASPILGKSRFAVGSTTRVIGTCSIPRRRKASTRCAPYRKSGVGQSATLPFRQDFDGGFSNCGPLAHQSPRLASWPLLPSTTLLKAP
jgi:hypothetical protein